MQKNHLSVQAFYPNITETIERVHRISTGILAALLQDDTLKFLLDHVYIATPNASDYALCKQFLQSENQGEELNEQPNFNGRRLSIWKLNKAWLFNDQLGQRQAVHYVEMGEPKPGQAENNRIAHIAYQVTENLGEHPVITAILNGQPKTVKTPDGSFTLESARIDSYGGLKIKTSIDQKPFEIELRQKPIAEIL